MSCGRVNGVLPEALSRKLSRAGAGAFFQRGKPSDARSVPHSLKIGATYSFT
jgi:hypothetical protein